ncbi:hypothetical protein ACFLIM_11125 [Nonomuraea sp. M3C6]|uniref:Uncharacterized protein n=1 Tax=Nonomuraea marmarensis TaxID=3351344 RepID=A0ABW7A8S3_9ACTN
MAVTLGYRWHRHGLARTAFDGLAPAQRREAAKSAALIAEATGDDQPTVTWI